MAETSGFQTDLQQSAYLATTMRRAISAAQQRSHRYVTLEHLLLALMDDADAQALLEGLRADHSAIKTSAADTVNRNLATLYTPGQFDLRASYKVERVLQTASDDARRLNCSEVDGAFVLAALAREIDSPAAEIVKHNGLGFTNAVTWLYANRGSRYSSPAAPAKPPAPPREPPPRPQMRDVQSQLREYQPQERERAAAAERLKATSPEALADEEALELEFEILDDNEPDVRRRPPLPSADAPKPIYGARPQLAQAEAAPAAKEASNQPASLQHRLERSPQPSSRGSENRPRPATPGQESASSEAPPASAAAARRPEAKVPLARLEEMRVRSPGATPQPVVTPPSASQAAMKARKKGAAPASAKGEQQKRTGSRRQRAAEAQAGKLVENIPRRMRCNVTERIEVRITREETEAFTRGMEGRGDAVHHDLLATSAMSVMLRAPDGGFTIEMLSPETQWIMEGVERPEDESYGRWRWAVTPTETGQYKLQLVVAARSVDINGVVGDTALPDQIITVRVRTNYWRNIKRGLQWAFVMAAGGVMTELGVKIFTALTKVQ